MFKALNQNQMMTVNGGGYYVPVYYYRVYWTGSYYKRETIKQTTEWVASGSKIKMIEYVNGRKTITYYK